jgi:PAS domain S-box-containing protein
MQPMLSSIPKPLRAGVFQFAALTTLPPVGASGSERLADAALGQWQHAHTDLAILLTAAGLGVMLAGCLLRARRIERDAERFRAIFEGSPQPIATSVDERLLKVNAPFARAFGFASPADVEGKPVLSVIAPEARDEILECTRNGTEEKSIDSRGLRPDGTSFPIHIRSTAFLQPEGRGRLAIIEELPITAQVPPPGQLREFDYLPNPVWRSDADGATIFVNRAWTEFTGREFAAEIGRGYLEGIHPDDRGRCTETFARAMSAQVPFVREYRLLHRTGEYRTVIDYGTPARSTTGVFEGYVGSCYDAHDLRLVQRSLHESEAQFQTLIENSSELVSIVNGEGVVQYQNPVVERLLGWSAADVVGKSVLEFVHPADRQRFGAWWLDRPEPITFRLRHRDGSWRHFESLLRRLPGSEPRAVVTSRDVTRTRALQEELDRAEKMSILGKVAANVTHEFSNVLMAIAPYATVLERRAGTDATTREVAAKIQQAIHRGREITEEILRFTRTGAPAMKTFDLAGWLEETGSSVAAIAGNAIRLEVRTSAAPLTITADSNQLHQAVLNMAINACHAMPDGGTLRLTAEPVSPDDLPDGLAPGEWICLTVADSGSGIPPEVLPRIFEPLFTTKQRGGTGLGLSITQQIVTRHGGTITVDSGPEMGTTFRIYLPKDAGAHTSALEIAHRPVALLVEDDPIVASGIEALLELSGFDTATFSEGRAAIQALAELDPAVALIDVGLPDVSGTEVYRTIRESRRTLPVIFSTGHGDDDALRAVSDDPHATCLIKPYDYALMIEAMLKTGVVLPSREGTA